MEGEPASGEKIMVSEAEQQTVQRENISDAEEKKAYYIKRPKLGERGPSKLRQHFSRGITSFLVIAAAILFYFALLRLDDLSAAVSKIYTASKPIIYGMAIAYVLNPIVRKVDQYLLPLLKKKLRHKTAVKISRSVGIFSAILCALALITMLCNMVIPELYKSIRDLVYNLPGQINDLIQWIDEFQMEDTPTNRFLHQALNEGADMLQKWLRTDLMSRTNIIMTNLTVGIISAVSEIFKFIVGIIVSVYVLFSKEKFFAQSKKAVYALFSPAHANMVLHITGKSNEIFGGFIIGKVIDSMIIGVLCYVGTSLLKMPYALLVSVIVGVTNVIPFFGPYIGAIPSAILILLESPMKGIYFILFILLLQQLDGNVIGPKILGDSTGLSAFWVVFSILLGGGLFGFAGMVLGVPTFAVLYYIVQMLLDTRLEKKKLPKVSDQYDQLSYVTDDGQYVPSPAQEKYEEKVESKPAKKEEKGD